MFFIWHLKESFGEMSSVCLGRIVPLLRVALIGALLLAACLSLGVSEHPWMFLF